MRDLRVQVRCEAIMRPSRKRSFVAMATLSGLLIVQGRRQAHDHVHDRNRLSCFDDYIAEEEAGFYDWKSPVVQVKKSGTWKDFPFGLAFQRQEEEEREEPYDEQHLESESTPSQFQDPVTLASTEHPDSSSTLQHSPLVYRFYGKSRSRAQSAGSIPFILLGPNVDHFKVIGQELASRGFSVIACERIRPDEGGSSAVDEHGATLIHELMDALKWNKAVLVGCDKESLAAVQAALDLAPQRIAGLVLCGNLKDAEELALRLDHSTRKTAGSFFLDRFLNQNVKCPFTVVWDGDDASVVGGGTLNDSPLLDSLRSNRFLIHGGGLAPHRRRPELFSWVLTRFVEERIAVNERKAITSPGARGGQQEQAHPQARPVQSPFRLQEFLSPESFVVTGRMVATAIFYWAMVKVMLHQYDNVCDGMVSIQSVVNSVGSFKTSVVSAISSVFPRMSLSFLAFRQSRQSKDEETNSEMEEVEMPGFPVDVDEDLAKDGEGPHATQDEQIPEDKNFQKRPPHFFLDNVVA